jgi:AcrR family transcriptional regulator
MPVAAVVSLESSTRTRILAAAAKRFAAFGYRRTGVAEIAREAGVAAGTLYRYFRDKEDIFRAVVRELNERWLARARGVLGEPGTAVERLARLGQASVEFNAENSLITSVFRRDHEIVFAPLMEELHEHLLRQNVALIADVLREGIREGTLRPLDPERTAYILFLGGEMLSNQMNRHHPYDEVLPLYTDITMNGLLLRAPAPTKRRTRR